MNSERVFKKYNFFGTSKWMVSAILGISAAIGLSSCDSGPLFDSEGDCDPHYYLQFVFERNMHYNDNNQIGADAFAAQVGSVDVYVFNQETGEYVTRFSEYGSALREYGYKMELDLEPGEYEFIAWCGLNDNEDHFTLPQTVGVNSDLKCRMARKVDESGQHYSDVCLNPLFHGTITADLPDDQGTYVYTIYLTKDTNYIELAMQHKAGPLDPEQFAVTIGDANGHLAHDNSILEDNDIEYRPWSQRSGVVDMWDGSRSDDDVADEDNGTGFLVAELATSRLMADRNPILTVTNKETGETVFSLPLVKYLLMMKSARYSTMDGQEYLDREDEHSIMVFLENKDDEGWKATQIVINGWHVTDNGIVGL